MTLLLLGGGLPFGENGLSPGGDVKPAGPLSHGEPPAVPTALTPLLAEIREALGRGQWGCGGGGCAGSRGFLQRKAFSAQHENSWLFCGVLGGLTSASWFRLRAGWPGRAGVCMGVSVGIPWGLGTVPVSLRPSPRGPSSGVCTEQVALRPPRPPGDTKGTRCEARVLRVVWARSSFSVASPTQPPTSAVATGSRPVPFLGSRWARASLSLPPCLA